MYRVLSTLIAVGASILRHCCSCSRLKFECSLGLHSNGLIACKIFFNLFTFHIFNKFPYNKISVYAQDGQERAFDERLFAALVTPRYAQLGQYPIALGVQQDRGTLHW